MQITKSLIDLILQFRCPNGDFASFDAKAMQNHLLICGKTNSKSEFQPCQLVKIKEEVKIEEDTFEEPKIPVEPASKIDEDSKAFFNSLIGKSNEPSGVSYGLPGSVVPYARFGPPAQPKKLFVPVIGPAVPAKLSPDLPLQPLSPTVLARHNLPAQPSFLVRPTLLKPVKPAPLTIEKRLHVNPRKMDLDLRKLNQFNHCINYNGCQIVVHQDQKLVKYLEDGNLQQMVSNSLIFFLKVQNKYSLLLFQVTYVLKKMLPNVEEYNLTGRTFTRDFVGIQNGAKPLPFELKMEINHFIVVTELLTNYPLLTNDLDSFMQRVYTKSFNTVRDAQNARIRSMRRTQKKYLRISENRVNQFAIKS